MSQPQEIVVKVDRKGKVTVEVNGVQGSGCQALTEALEAELGKKTGGAVKEEFFQPKQENVQWLTN